MRMIPFASRILGVASLAASLACGAQQAAGAHGTDSAYTAPDAATLTKLQAAADHGDRNAQRDLALYFDKVKNDWASALPWFRKAAEQDDPRS
ncbi:MAG TPA: hypothetical protein VGC19_07330 [Rhodanobacter sp.]